MPSGAGVLCTIVGYVPMFVSQMFSFLIGSVVSSVNTSFATFWNGECDGLVGVMGDDDGFSEK